MTGIGRRARLPRHARDAVAVLTDEPGPAHRTVLAVVRLHALPHAGRAVDRADAARLAVHRAGRPVRARHAGAVAADRIFVTGRSVVLQHVHLATGRNAPLGARHFTAMTGIGRNARYAGHTDARTAALRHARVLVGPSLADDGGSAVEGRVRAVGLGDLVNAEQRIATD